MADRASSARVRTADSVQQQEAAGAAEAAEAVDGWERGGRTPMRPAKRPRRDEGAASMGRRPVRGGKSPKAMVAAADAPREPPLGQLWSDRREFLLPQNLLQTAINDLVAALPAEMPHVDRLAAWLREFALGLCHGLSFLVAAMEVADHVTWAETAIDRMYAVLRNARVGDPEFELKLRPCLKLLLRLHEAITAEGTSRAESEASRRGRRKKTKLGFTNDEIRRLGWFLVLTQRDADILFLSCEHCEPPLFTRVATLGVVSDHVGHQEGIDRVHKEIDGLAARASALVGLIITGRTTKRDGQRRTVMHACLDKARIGRVPQFSDPSVGAAKYGWPCKRAMKADWWTATVGVQELFDQTGQGRPRHTPIAAVYYVVGPTRATARAMGAPTQICTGFEDPAHATTLADMALASGAPWLLADDFGMESSEQVLDCLQAATARAIKAELSLQHTEGASDNAWQVVERLSRACARTPGWGGSEEKWRTGLVCAMLAQLSTAKSVSAVLGVAFDGADPATVDGILAATCEAGPDGQNVMRYFLQTARLEAIAWVFWQMRSHGSAMGPQLLQALDTEATTELSGDDMRLRVQLMLASDLELNEITARDIQRLAAMALRFLSSDTPASAKHLVALCIVQRLEDVIRLGVSVSDLDQFEAEIVRLVPDMDVARLFELMHRRIAASSDDRTAVGQAALP